MKKQFLKLAHSHEVANRVDAWLGEVLQRDELKCTKAYLDMHASGKEKLTSLTFIFGGRTMSMPQNANAPSESTKRLTSAIAISNLAMAKLSRFTELNHDKNERLHQLVLV